MTTNFAPNSELKAMLKDALIEVLQERRDLLQEVIVEALEEWALGEAIREGLKSKPASREEVMRVLRA